MAKNKVIKPVRITARHKETPAQVLSTIKYAQKKYPDNELLFMLTDQKGDVVNKTIKSSGYKYKVNPASRYDAKDLTRGAKLRRKAELDYGIEYFSVGDEGKIKGGYDKYWSDFYKHLQNTNPTHTYDKTTGKRIGSSTSATHNPKDLLLAEIKDTKDPAKHQAGVDFVQGKVSAWEAKQKENPSVKKSISFSEGSKKWAVWKGKEIKFNYTEPPKVYPWLNKGQQDKLDIETGDKAEVSPSGARTVKTYDNPHKEYLESDIDELNQSGKNSITKIKAGITSPFSGKDISGKNLSKTMKVQNKGTILTGHKSKTPPRNISPTYLDAPKPKYTDGPNTYSKSASVSQFENTEYAPANDLKDYQKEVIESGKVADKETFSEGTKKHKTKFLQEVKHELRTDISELEHHVKTARGKSLLTNVPDALARGDIVTRTNFETGEVSSDGNIKSQTAHPANVPPPKNYYPSKAQKNRKAFLAKVNNASDNIITETKAREKLIKQNTGRVTAKARYQHVPPKTVKSNSPVIHRIKSLHLTKQQFDSFKNRKTDIISKTQSLPVSNQREWTFQKKYYEGAGDKLSLEQGIAKKAKNAPTFHSKKGRVKRTTKTKLVTTGVTPSLKKMRPNPGRSTKKVVTGYPAFKAETVSQQVIREFKTKPGNANVEYKHRNSKTTGKGIKFTRGLGTFNILSSLLGIGRGMKEAKEDFKKMGVKRSPTALENLSYQFIPKNVLKRTRLPTYGKDS
tara:strand:- start:3447 stop:5660 length:2214 start_codon:yes stop_codon:yes gene_type:complete